MTKASRKSNKCTTKNCNKTRYRKSVLCSACRSRARRAKVGYIDAYKYEKTINGFLVRLYRNMKSRITGIQKEKHYLYVGKKLIDKELFYSWAKNHPDFLRLYKEWVNYEYNRKLTPSVNRINPDKGYTIDNMEWVTNSQNSALSSVTRKIKNKEKIAIYRVLGVTL
jgi:hypothetical protein